MASEVYSDVALANLSVSHSFRNGTVALMVAPIVVSTKQTGKVWRLDAAQDARHVKSTRRNPGGTPFLADFDVDQAITFSAIDHSLEGRVSDEEINQAEDALQPRTNKTRYLTTLIDIDREKALVTLIKATFTGAQTGAVTAWSDKVDGDPLGDINAKISVVKAASGVIPNAIVMDESKLRDIKEHPDFLDRVKHGGYGDVIEGGLDVAARAVASITGLDEVIWARLAVERTSAKGETKVMANIWDDGSTLLFHKEASPSFGSANSLVHIVYNGVGGGVTGGVEIVAVRDDVLKSERMVIHSYYDQIALGDATQVAPGFRFTGN